MSTWDKLWDKDREKIHTAWHPEAYFSEWVTKVKAEGDKLKDELEFIRRTYGDALPESLTRDALKLKIAVLEQNREEALKLIPDICLFGDCDFAPMTLTGDTPDNYCGDCPVRKLYLILTQEETKKRP